MKHSSMRINQLRMTVTNIYNLLKLVAKEIYESQISKIKLDFSGMCHSVTIGWQYLLGNVCSRYI